MVYAYWDYDNHGMDEYEDYEEFFGEDDILYCHICDREVLHHVYDDYTVCQSCGLQLNDYPHYQDEDED